jgi:hypothetical protein
MVDEIDRGPRPNLQNTRPIAAAVSDNLTDPQPLIDLKVGLTGEVKVVHPGDA